jgi:hypothetical protein
MDTTSNALARIIWLLSQNIDVQDKLRKEIREAHQRCGGDRLGYDELISLPFLDAVCRETLRLYAILSFVGQSMDSQSVSPQLRPCPYYRPRVRHPSDTFISQVQEPTPY